MFLLAPSFVQYVTQHIKFGIVDREQYQRHFDPGLSTTKPANRTDLYSRIRPEVNATLGKDLNLEFVYQYSTDYTGNANLHPSPVRSDLDRFDLQDKVGDGTAILGRQLLIEGNGRLLGDPDFGVTGRTWDLARYHTKSLDAFAGKLGVSTTESKNSRMAGVAFTTPSFGTTMLVYKHDYNLSPGSTDVYALDQLYKKKFGNLAADLELVGEEGHTASGPMRAWAYSGRLTYSPTKSSTVYVEVDAASGGKSGKTTFTFDQLYPGNHPYYGILDIIGWRNMNDFMFGSTYRESSKTVTTFEIHDFSLRASNDYLYADAGAATKYVDPTGKSGANVGSELDLFQKFALNSHHSFELGGAIFMPGKFIDRLTAKGTNPEYWLYAQYTLKF